MGAPPPLRLHVVVVDDVGIGADVIVVVGIRGAACKRGRARSIEQQHRTSAHHNNKGPSPLVPEAPESVSALLVQRPF